MSAASNTTACFEEFIGLKVVGFLEGGLHAHRANLKTLVFEDGRGLSFNDNGSYWITRAEDVATAARRIEKELATTKHRLKGVRALIGADA